MTKSKVYLPENVKQLMQRLIDNGYNTMVIGGAVKDHYMHVEPNDYDVFGNCKDLLKIFPEGHIIGGKERQEKILTIIVDGVEISTYRKSGDRKILGETLEEHQATCDFTMNSIACDINGDIDLTNKYNIQGIKDINDKILRFVGSPKIRIEEDELRILRGIRFILKCNLTVEKTTLSYLEPYINGEKTLNVPKERIRDELMKILELDLKYDFLYYIGMFLPSALEDEKMLCDGGGHHNETPLAHSIYAFLEASKLTKNNLIKIAALLHDSGKATDRGEKYICPDCGNKMLHIKPNKLDCDCGLCCCEDEVKPKVTFYGHHHTGAKIVRAWMTGMKFSNKEIDFVVCLVENHMHGLMNEVPSTKSYIRLFHELRQKRVDIIDYISLCYADNQGNLKQPRMKFVDYLKDNHYLKAYIRFKKDNIPLELSELAISGKDIIERYHITNGLAIGNILRFVFNRIKDDSLKNNKEVILKHLDVKYTHNDMVTSLEDLNKLRLKHKEKINKGEKNVMDE